MSWAIDALIPWSLLAATAAPAPEPQMRMPRTATAPADVAAVDLEARKHTGEGAYAKKPGPHHPTILEGVA